MPPLDSFDSCKHMYVLLAWLHCTSLMDIESHGVEQVISSEILGLNEM